MRNRAWRRAQRKRVINQRMFIVKNKWYEVPSLWLKNGSRLSKYNLVCSCNMCRDSKYRDTRQKYASVT